MNVFDQYGAKGVVRKSGSPPARIIAQYPDFLMHFGTKGMKWGVRQFQNEDGTLTQLGRQRYGIKGERGARGVARDLNRLDKEIVRSQAKADRYRTKFERSYSKKEYRAEKRGESVADKSKKEQKLEAKAKAYQDLANRGKKMTEQIIKNANAKGMSIHSKDFKRQVNVGSNALFNLLALNTTGVGRMDMAVGTKYKVKNDGKGGNAHKKKYDRSQKTRVYVTNTGAHDPYGYGHAMRRPAG